MLGGALAGPLGWEAELGWVASWRRRAFLIDGVGKAFDPSPWGGPWGSLSLVLRLLRFLFLRALASSRGVVLASSCAGRHAAGVFALSCADVMEPTTTYIRRHGPAEDDSASGQDFDRALSAPGRERVLSVARELLARGEAPRIILASPLTRALQTAELVAHVCAPAEPVRVRREIAPGGDLRGLLDEVIRAGTPRVMLVGHEPSLSELVDAVLPGGFPDAFEKAMVVGLLTDGNPIRRRFTLAPKTLAWR
jgi:phosphohistidine phosphatase